MIKVLGENYVSSNAINQQLRKHRRIKSAAAIIVLLFPLTGCDMDNSRCKLSSGEVCVPLRGNSCNPLLLLLAPE